MWYAVGGALLLYWVLTGGVRERVERFNNPTGQALDLAALVAACALLYVGIFT